jgi:hypothetical protein
VKHFILGLSLGLALVACASREYKVYVLSTKDQTLRGPELRDDLPISVCDETPQSKANCYVMLRAEYIKLRNDLIEYKRRLQACEKR